LHQIGLEEEKTLKKKLDGYFKKSRSLDLLDEKEKEEYEQNFKEASEIGGSKLAQYVFHRKYVLEILEKKLKLKLENKKKGYQYEEAIHNLIFPIRTTSDDLGYKDHNLWLIDERLTYQSYIASDKKFKKIPKVAIESEDRPDLICFRGPFTFSENEANQSSIVIIEFKRPGVDDFDQSGKSPVDQVIRYIKTLRSGDAKTKNGRPLAPEAATPIFAYILCDEGKSIKNVIKDRDFRENPFGGAYYYHENQNAYIEIIYYDKLVKDAKKRNKAFFDELNLS